ncbi:hypothetical protein VNO80_32045 [Phaseolus coccineus]|uniref:Senescence-associated protein n=1 Tax=Phaseolus coccineus TaxID=3886 RepID=A0AAN9L070_PHACN
MLSLEPFTEDQGSVGGATHMGIPPISFLAPYGFTHPLTRTHVRLLGPCFKTGRMGEPTGRRPERARAETRHEARLPSTIATMTSPRAFQQPGLGPPLQSASVNVPSRSADRLTPFHIRRDTSPAPIRFPPDNFKHSLTLFSKSFSSFPRGSGHNGALTLSGAPFQGTWARSATEDASPDYNSNAEGGPISWWAFPGSLAVTRGILRARVGSVSPLCPESHSHDWSRAWAHPPISQGDSVPNLLFNQPREGGVTMCGHPGRRALSLMALGATCVQRLDGSRDSGNSHQVSHFATFFIDARAEISVAESHFT